MEEIGSCRKRKWLIVKQKRFRRGQTANGRSDRCSGRRWIGEGELWKRYESVVEKWNINHFLVSL